MTELNPPTASDSAAWRVQMVRFTVFSATPIDVQQIEWWRELLDADPEETRVSRAAGTQRQEEGAFGGGRLVLRAESNRVDWILSAVASEGEADPFVAIAPLPEPLESFLPLMLRWTSCSSFPEASRL